MRENNRKSFHATATSIFVAAFAEMFCNDGNEVLLRLGERCASENGEQSMCGVDRVRRQDGALAGGTGEMTPLIRARDGAG